MKKCSFTLNNYIFHLPRRRMDPYSIYVEDLPKNVTYADINDAFCPLQRSPPLRITKKENYLIIGFEKKETVKRILKHRDSIMLKGKVVTIKQAFVQFQPTYVHIPPSFLLPPSSLFLLPPPPPQCLHLVPPFFIPSPAPVPPPAPYEHPFPEGFSYFYYK